MYQVKWESDEYGYINIEAKSEEEAKELFMSGEFKEEDMVYKNGSKNVYEVIKI
jgi:hypothetical protein